MSRITLAFSSFFRLLFGGRLHPSAAEYLPESAKPALPKGEDSGNQGDKGGDSAGSSSAADKADGDGKSDGDAAASSSDAKPDDSHEKSPYRRSANLAEHHRDGALSLLSLLQREGRLVDFLLEDLDDYDDEDIGASVRDIHRGCRKVIDEHLELEPVMPGEEDEDVNVPKGFDPGEIRLVGDVSGDPPFQGVMRHHGWRVIEAKLPTLTEGVDRHVLAPAEVEIS